MRYLFTLACLLLVTATVADDADFDFDSVAAKKAFRDYNKAVAKDEKARGQKQKLLDEDGTKQEKKTRNAFVENLKKALKKSMQAGNLDEANKINAAIKALEKGADPVTSSAAESKGKKNANSKARIPKSAVKWNGHHYLLSDRRVLHPDAKQRCESAGGHLIRIDDAREQAFAARLASKGTQVAYWIDGSDEIREGRCGCLVMGSR
ncbi:MAG: C-type lectin domain-containing protein [Alphaproteobacteria bacterium]|nr:C-type lectin domain-containing protein [Alphaproteobacteria bacterium]